MVDPLTGWMRNTTLLVVSAAALAQAAGGANVVFCHNAEGMDIEVSVAGNCLPGRDNDSQPWTLFIDSSCGPCVDVPLAKTFLSQSSSRRLSVVDLSATGTVVDILPDAATPTASNKNVLLASTSPLLIIRSSILLI